MEKIAVGPKIGNVVSLSKSVEENLDAIAKKTGKKMNEITVVVLDRPRHQDIIHRVKSKGANVKLIKEGDVFGAIITAFECEIDMLLGIGAAPEGVLAATALKIVGGYFEGRLKPKNDDEKQRAEKMGIKNIDKIYNINELVKGDDAIFVATGVTDGDMLKGVDKEPEYEAHIDENGMIVPNDLPRYFLTVTHSIVMNSSNKIARFIVNKRYM